jgi:hypothetical protein
LISANLYGAANFVIYKMTTQLNGTWTQKRKHRTPQITVNRRVIGRIHRLDMLTVEVRAGNPIWKHR